MRMELTEAFGGMRYDRSLRVWPFAVWGEFGVCDVYELYLYSMYGAHHSLQYPWIVRGAWRPCFHPKKYCTVSLPS